MLCALTFDAWTGGSKPKGIKIEFASLPSSCMSDLEKGDNIAAPVSNLSKTWLGCPPQPIQRNANGNAAANLPEHFKC